MPSPFLLGQSENLWQQIVLALSHDFDEVDDLGLLARSGYVEQMNTLAPGYLPGMALTGPDASALAHLVVIPTVSGEQPEAGRIGFAADADPVFSPRMEGT